MRGVRVVFAPSVLREYKKLPKDIQERVNNLLDGLFVTAPFAPQFRVKKLQEPLFGYRIRLGDYRLLFRVEADIILIYSIKHRKDAYR